LGHEQQLQDVVKKGDIKFFHITINHCHYYKTSTAKLGGYHFYR